jgi:hypothetical protein
MQPPVGAKIPERIDQLFRQSETPELARFDLEGMIFLNLESRILILNLES